MSHTPGPWKAEFSEDGGYDCMTDAWMVKADTKPFIVAVVDCSGYGQTPRNREYQTEHAKADAALIAAAPDLLAALKALRPIVPPIDGLCHRHICEPSECAYCQQMRQAVAAIAKAEGTRAGKTP